MAMVSTLEEHHIEGLAALCVELYVAKENIPRLRIKRREHQPEGSFTQILIQYLQMSAGTQMIFLLRFASMYLQYVFCAINDPIVDSTNISAVILPDLVKKFAFICTRCMPELCDLGEKIIHDDDAFPNREWIFQLYSSKKFQQILQQIKLTFPEWVELEIKVNPEQDLLNVVERFNHYTWAVYRKYLPMEEKDGGCNNDYRLAARLILEKLINSYTSQHISPLQECARCSEAQNFSRLTNSTEMVTALQGLVISFHHGNNADEDQLKTPKLPWLLDYLRREAFDSQEISTNAKVTAFFRLYMYLPSYLLFMDSLSPHSWAPLSMKRIINLLNKHLIMLDMGNCLPLSLTTNILKGLSAVDSVTGKEVMKEFLSGCPLVMVSVMIHVENLKHIIKWTNYLQTIFDLLEQIDRTFDEVEAVFPASCGKDLDTSVISLALLSATLRRKSRNGVHFMLEKMAKHREVLSIYAELLLCYCSRNEQLWPSNSYLSITNVVRGILADLLTSHQVLHSLCTENEAQTVVQRIFPDVVFKLKHITLIRIICQCGSLSISTKEGNLTQILILFRTVSALFESVLKSEENRKLPAIKDPMTVMDLIAATNFIKRCIQEAPIVYLQVLDQGLLAECGTEVQEEVHIRLIAEGFR
ncbi:hypothetical protein CHS0354_029246 [Potamilus streckersoni]|uniref:Fanconi anaemia group A protein arcN subdomain domain-containing protein n=1 Tax=Potamilus streckersoni TaxID=2493646 RepID=A0AAE0RM53_9BIVA|nr:hypothetical protein CHS0354_029246 [Potamilus streckersoni]